MSKPRRKGCRPYGTGATKSILIRCSETEKDRIKSAAQDAEVSMASYILDAIEFAALNGFKAAPKKPWPEESDAGQ